DGAARGTAAMTDDLCRLAGPRAALDRPAQRISRRRSRPEARGRPEGGDRVRLQQAGLQHRRAESNEVRRRGDKVARPGRTGVSGPTPGPVRDTAEALGLGDGRALHGEGLEHLANHETSKWLPRPALHRWPRANTTP